MRVRTIIVNDKMQRGYRYALVAPAGRRFAAEFTPELSPKEMLQLGVFGGKFMTDTTAEFPKSWFAKAKLSPQRPHPACNCFGVLASQPLSVWRKNGWIHPDDPRGWFQWYCRYYLGRRNPEEDRRQIKRWKAMRRHAAQIRQHCEPGNLFCRRRQRQALLHWPMTSGTSDGQDRGPGPAATAALVLTGASRMRPTSNNASRHYQLGPGRLRLESPIGDP